MSINKKIVLKFGGSVLHSPADFDGIYQEIKRYVDTGYKVVAVVSAYFGVTESLVATAKSKQLSSNEVAYAELISSGEFKSASELVTHLLDHGLPACKRRPAELGFVAKGKRAAAYPISLDAQKLLNAFEHSSVVVVPGFSAIDEHGDYVLLGRGGSDISAVCIAQALSLDSVRLIKDVDGLYDHDPNKFASAKRLAYVSYQTAKAIGGELIQPEAIDFAAQKNIFIDVSAIGHRFYSRIGYTKTSAFSNRQAEELNSPISLP